MRRVVDIPTGRTVPMGQTALRAMGVPAGHAPDPRVEDALKQATGTYVAQAEPRGMIAQIGVDEFATVYDGDGDNEDPSPLAEIFPRAEALVLFAATVGQDISDSISELFEAGALATAVTLDAVASAGVELAAEFLDGIVLESLRARGEVSESSVVLRYSPGYCGWSLTGQRALFGTLHPEQIGIRLLESCLMEPIKSISGVMVLGPAEIHEFADHFAFCSECRTKECRRRIASLRSSESGARGTD